MAYLCATVEYKGKKWAFYAFEDKPGQVKTQIEMTRNLQRRLTAEESTMATFDSNLIYVRESLILQAGEKWPEWESYAERIRNVPDN